MQVQENSEGNNEYSVPLMVAGVVIAFVVGSCCICFLLTAGCCHTYYGIGKVPIITEACESIDAPVRSRCAGHAFEDDCYIPTRDACCVFWSFLFCSGGIYCSVTLLSKLLYDGTKPN